MSENTNSIKKDIYFDDNYGKLYEKIENGKAQVFYYKDEFGEIKHQFIIKKIPIKINNDYFYDIVTPYGYGGPIIKKCIEGKKDELLKNYFEAFSKYCEKNKIISEFIRFHPVVGNATDFSEYYETVYVRNTVGTNLKDFEDPFQSEFSKSCRRNVRKALKGDISYKITENPTDINNFKEIYYSTMDRNNANDYYYFDDEYFNKCLKYFNKNILLVEAIYKSQTIAMGFYFIYDNFIHIHLSGTLSEYLPLSPAYVLRYAVTKWGKEKGYKVIHHGGGRTNDSNDGLYLFKKQFGKNTDYLFYIGKKIWNKEIYDELCKRSDTNDNADFFPKYRHR